MNPGVSLTDNLPSEDTDKFKANTNRSKQDGQHKQVISVLTWTNEQQALLQMKTRKCLFDCDYGTGKYTQRSLEMALDPTLISLYSSKMT